MTAPDQSIAPTEALRDEISDIIRPIHWETWKAALFSDNPTGWPNDDEQQAITRRVDDMAVLEHWAAWGDEIVGKVAALIASRAAEAEAPRSMDCAPTDGTMVRLLVNYRDGDHALEDEVVAWTIGFNNDDNVVEGEGQGWQFAGWCWTHDHYTDGEGKPIGWLPWTNPAQPRLFVGVPVEGASA